jgi:two-component system OmpR family sensor kinase/two-component system sensor histidine kinase BaeS
MNLWNTLWVRLTLALTLGMLIAVGAIALLIRQTTDVEFRQYITHSDLRASGRGTQILATYYQEQGSWEGVESLLGGGILIDRIDRMPGLPGGNWPPNAPGKVDVMLADARGKVVFDSADQAAGKRLSAREKSRALPLTSLADESQMIGYLLLSVPERSDILGRLERHFLQRVQNVLLIAAAIAVALGLVSGALLSRGLTAPLQRLAAAARAVGRGDLDVQVKVEGSAEITEVSQAFNEMTAALEEGERLRQNLVADVAHELRTPLSVLQGNLRALLDGV